MYGPPIVPNANCTLGTNPGRTYRFFNGKAVVPFGFGLSYTTWSYAVASAPAAPVDTAKLQALLDVTKESTGAHFPKLEDVPAAGQYVLNVTNTGTVDADDVVLGFISPPGAGTNGLPLQSLFGFERVFVRAGETVQVYLYPALTELATTGLNGEKQPQLGDHTVKFGVVEGAAHGMGYAESTLTAV